MNSIIIDVRERDEYEAEHVEHSILIPLSEFHSRAPAILRSLQGRPIQLLCRSGKRALLAEEQARSILGQQAQIKVMEGGILRWKDEGHPTVKSKGSHFPIMRQVQLIAGLLIVTSVMLTHFWSPSAIWLAGLVGVGLTIAGSTGFCGMAILLSKMPWNRIPTCPSERKTA